ncbi:hypothetical protein NX801_26565 [Streptomyces sp. LP05-1]|uniref:Uncharacterized protein n=1 Tax=Streptomyces pyxinae TaxID=2970734 RepID=A0ABT2CNX2_9ACTN|nr:hypothetical protein [Streptomyces sp. LP05-1]
MAGRSAAAQAEAADSWYSPDSSGRSPSATGMCHWPVGSVGAGGAAEAGAGAGSGAAASRKSHRAVALGSYGASYSAPRGSYSAP